MVGSPEAPRIASVRNPRSPRSRTVVTPPSAAVRAADAMASRAASSSLASSAPTGSAEASKTRWTWVSTRPGSSVAPSRSMTSTSSGGPTPSATATMRSPSINTIGRGRSAGVVPSYSHAARSATRRTGEEAGFNVTAFITFPVRPSRVASSFRASTARGEQHNAPDQHSRPADCAAPLGIGT